jgi:hypothetical protein
MACSPPFDFANSNQFATLLHMKENVRIHIESMIDGRAETVVLADRLLTSSEYERIRENAEELEEEMPFEEEWIGVQNTCCFGYCC